MKNKLILSIISGVSLSLSFPDFYIPFLFLIGYGILFHLILKSENFMKSSFYSFISGFVFSSISFYWIIYAVVFYGNVSFYLAIPVFLVFCVTFSVFQFVVFGIIAKWLYIKFNIKAVFLFPFVWFLIELLREYFPFGGFPWLLSGYMISYINPLAQISHIFGIYGLSLLVFFLSSFTFYFFISKTLKSSFLLILMVILVAGLWFYGDYRVNKFFREGKTVKIAILQGNIPEDIKQNVLMGKQIVDIYISLFKQVANKKPDLIVLPESALPFYPRDKKSKLSKYFFENIKDIKIPFLTGYDDIFLKDGKYYIYNAVYLYDKNHKVVGVYKKIKLVPFGEYVPYPFGKLSSIFPYLSGYDFLSGEKINVLKCQKFKIAPFVCFEIIFPSLLTKYKDKNINLLVNISNDAWFGKTSAPFQHFEMAKVRAIESGRYLIRGANTGISAIVNPVGKIERFKNIYERGYIIGEVKLFDENSFFMNYRLFILLGIIFLGLFLFYIFNKQEKK